MIKKVALGTVCQFENGDRGKNYPSQSSFVEKGIPFVNAGNISNYSISHNNLNFINEERYNLLGSGKLQPNDILFCLRGSLGKHAINKEGLVGAIASSLVIIRPKEDLDVNYLHNYLKSDIVKRLVTKSDNGSSQPNLSASNVKKFPIPLPSIEIQKKIAGILDAADALRKKTQQILEHYDQLAQSIFLDMFGDPVSNPRKWEVKKLKSLSTKILSGNTPKGGSKVYVDDGILFLRSQNVWRNRLKLNDVAYIDNATHSKMRNTSLTNKDILMTKTGRSYTKNSSLGRAAMFLGKDDSANINGHVYLIRLKKEIINEFVLYIITTNSYRDHMRRVCVGGIDKMQLNKHHLEDFPIINPPVELQNQFVVKLKLIEQQKELAKQSLQQSEDLFHALLQKAFLPAGRQGKGDLVNE